MSLRRIAQRIESVHGEPLPCRVETLAVALKRTGFSRKRARYSLKKSATSRTSLMKAITLSKLQKAARDGQCRLIY